MKVISARNAWRYLLGAAFIAATSCFLLKLAYLGVWPATAIGVALSLAFYAYARRLFGVGTSVLWLLPLLGSVEVDAQGNHFHLYGKAFGPMQYDELSHMLCSALVTPVTVWAVKAGLCRGGVRLPPGPVALATAAAVFSLCGFYEVIELWDERYVHGRRIWGPYDTSNDLQWDLFGVVCGAALAHLITAVARARRRAAVSIGGRRQSLSRLPQQ
jgi:hypothetical protein